MQCENCGTVVSNHANYCKNCGSPIQKSCTLKKKDELTFNEAKMLSLWVNKYVGTVITDYNLETFGPKINKILNDFLEVELLTTSSFQDNIKCATIPELRAFLKKNGMSISGSKNILIERILDSIDEDVINCDFDKYSRYKLTPKGEQQIDKYNLFFINEYQGYGFLQTELKQTQASCPDASDGEIIWLLLIKRYQQQFLECNSDILFTSKHLEKLSFNKEDYQASIILSFQIEWVYLSGCSGKTGSHYVYDSNRALDSSAIKNIDDSLNELLWSLDDLESFLLESSSQLLQLPFSLYSPKTLIQMIIDKISGNEKSIFEYHKNTPISNSPLYKSSIFAVE
jgi:hypothetical protein